MAVGLAAVHVRKCHKTASCLPRTYIRSVTHIGSRALATLASDSPLFSSIASDTAMASIKPPQEPPSWTHSAEDIDRIIKDLIERDRKLTDQVAALDPKDCTFESVCLD